MEIYGAIHLQRIIANPAKWVCGAPGSPSFGKPNFGELEAPIRRSSYAKCASEGGMVRPARLELATPGLGNRCSILLSYGRAR
jgi:hypothetical protein